MLKLLWMKADKRSWSAGTRNAIRSCGFEKVFADAPQRWGVLSRLLVPRGFLKNQLRRAVRVLLEGDGELRRNCWAASAESDGYIVNKDLPSELSELTISLQFVSDLHYELHFLLLSCFW